MSSISQSKLLAGLFVTSVSLGGLIASCGLPSQTDSKINQFTVDQFDGSSLGDKTVSLTFDDGPGGRTLELARYLKTNGIEATFFMVGSEVARFPSVVAEVKRLGHLVANHSYTHDSMPQSNDPVAEVRDTDRLIAPHVTGNMFLFRAPFGAWASRLPGILNGSGLRKYVGPIFWDVGGQTTSRYAADWDCWGAANLSITECGESYLNEIRDRRKGIVLFHDVHSNSIDMVKNIIVPRLKAEGYRFVRLDAVPAIAAELRRSGGSPGAGGTTPPVVIGKIQCPVGFTLTSVGTAGGKICLSETQAFGPFTQAMKGKCFGWGGGTACESNNWAKSMALSARGTALCPLGAAHDPETTYCVEGSDAFGPFPKAIVEKCQAQGGGTSCASARYNRNFLKSLL